MDLIFTCPQNTQKEIYMQNIINANSSFPSSENETSVTPVRLRAQLSIDGPIRKKEALPNEYGGVYGHPVANAGETIQLIVSVYPTDAQWFLEFENYENLLESGIMHTGDAVIDLPIPSRTNTEYLLHRIFVRPANSTAAINPNVVVSFWSKYEEGPTPSAISPTYRWDFENENFIDSEESLELAPVGTAAVAYTTDNALRGKSAKIETVGVFAASNVPFDATAGATIMGFVRGNGLQSRFGFYEANTNITTGNCFLIEWGYRQPNFWIPKKGYRLLPTTSTSDRWNLTTSWHHLAIVITPIADLTTFEGVTYDETSDKYVWISPTLGNTVTKSWAAHFSATSAKEGVDGNDFYIARSYVDGVVLQEMIFPELKTLADSPDHCLRKLGNGYLLCQLLHTTDHVDELTLIDSPLTIQQIQNECTSAGVPIRGTTPSPITPRPVTKLSRPNKPLDITTVQPAAHLKAWVIDASTVAVAGDYFDWFRERLLTEFGDDLPNIEWNYRNAGSADYLRNWYYRYGLWELYGDYQPLIRDKFDSAGFFTINGTPTTLIGRWSNSNRDVEFPDLLDGTEMVRSCQCANIIHIAYLSLNSPMTEGNSYTIMDADGNSTTFTYGPDTPSAAIKVNQSGYSPAAAKRYAYLGLWLGTGGAYQPSPVPQNFYIVPVGGGSAVFTGTISLRKSAEDDLLASNGKSYKLTGETVWELDMSSFANIGKFQIFIQGIGYSYPFEIGAAGIGRQFFYSMQGLFQQRSGIPKVSPYTKWESPVSGQPWSFESEFCSLNGYKQQAYGSQTVDDDGNTYSSVYSGNSQFPMVANNKTGKIFRDIHGGWMDAADYDKRGFHLQAVDMLTFAYLLYPENFTDGQLQIPESGNGIPDILSEAEWGLDVWRRSQYDNGGIGGWIESTQHEANLPWQSDVEYCLARPSRHDSLKYAFSAARFARSLIIVNTPLALAKAEIYKNSAIRAFAFGADPANCCTFEFTQDGKHWTHTEENSEADIFLFRAAAAMYTLTNDNSYTAYLNNTNFDLLQNPWIYGYEGLNYCSPEILLELAEEFPVYHAKHRARILGKAHEWLGYQKQHAYRWLFWGPAEKAGYVKGGFSGWGAAHPGHRGWLFILASKILEGQGVHNEYNLQDKPYEIEAGIDFRTAAHLALDWAMGCNAFGRTTTTGVGYNYPVWCLCSWLPSAQISSKDGNGRMIEENFPGITPYTFANSVANGIPYVYCLNMGARSDVNYPGITKSIFPAAIDFANTDNVTDARDIYATYVPIQRHYIEVGSYTVAASEYTVWETIAPMASLAGCLMGTGFVPGTDWKTREPIRDRYALDGYIFLP